MVSDGNDSTKKDVRLYRMKEASEILNVSVHTLRRWCNKGLVKCIRLPNNHRRIPAEEIERILSGGRDE
ncbi:MerR family transcriptional regulator [Archaeoglobus neptunius]|uniref:MerR family transcriptional regulator n=1 Tax=Archaeoglobus neptunius TaxID=2798580 RepID=UPI0038B374A6